MTTLIFGKNSQVGKELLNFTVNSEIDWPRHDAGEVANPKVEANESQATTKKQEKTRDLRGTRLNRTMMKHLEIFVLFPRRYLNR